VNSELRIETVWKERSGVVWGISLASS